MNQLNEMIKNLVKQLNEITELFYQQKKTEALKKFGNTLTMLESLAQSIFNVPEITEEDKNAFLKYLTEAMNAMEEGDSILLSDILQYDLVEYLEGLAQKLV